MWPRYSYKAVFLTKTKLARILDGMFAEMQLTFRLLQSNGVGALGAIICASYSRLLVHPLSTTMILRLMLDTFLTGFAFGYTFDIVNQSLSVLEDKINKPDRPIPSGLLTLEKAYQRCIVSWVVSPLIVYWLSGPWTAFYLLIWQSWVFFCYVWPAWNHWLLRNLFTSLGLVIQLRISNALLTHRVPQLHIHIIPDLQIGLWGLLTIHIQEFKDVDGDRLSKTNTLPLILQPDSLRALRYSTALVILLLHTMQIAQTWFMCQLTFCRGAYMAATLNLMLACIVASRLTTNYCKQKDKITYFFYYIPLGLAAVLHHAVLFTPT